MLSIAWKDLLILLKDRNNLIATFLLPVVFIVVYLGVSAATTGGGTTSASADPEKKPLAVVNNDGGAAASELLASLEARSGVLPTVYSETDAMTMLDAHQTSQVLVIPAGFTANVEGNVHATLELRSNTLDRGQAEAMLMAVQGVTRNMSLELEIVAALERLAAMQAANPSFDPATSADKAIPIAREQFAASQARPLVTVVQAQPAALGQEAPVVISGVQLGVPGFAVLFIFLTAQVTARSIYDEKKTGTFRRLLASPLGKWQMLIGKLIPNFVIVLLQATFLFAVGVFVLPLMGLDRLTLGRDPLALILLVLATALCCTSLGILIAAIARSEAQIGGIAGLVLWVLGFLGGSFIPLFLINESLATIGQVTPHFWAVTGSTTCSRATWGCRRS